MTNSTTFLLARVLPSLPVLLILLVTVPMAAAAAAAAVVVVAEGVRGLCFAGVGVRLIDVVLA